MTAVLVLDFDGTVLDTEWPAYTAAAELWADHGIELTVEDWAWRIGTNGHDDPFTELQKRLGRALDPALQEQRIARKNALTDAAPLNPGILSWLAEAERLAVPVGIASSSPVSWIERNLARLGLRDRFSCLACAGDALPAKPDPTSFRHAVEQLGGEVARSVAVEDSEHGITAAADAGLYTVAVPHRLTAPPPTWTWPGPTSSSPRSTSSHSPRPSDEPPAAEGSGRSRTYAVHQRPKPGQGRRRATS